MKLSWILVLCLVVYFCSSEVTPENEELAAVLNSEAESSDGDALPMESERKKRVNKVQNHCSGGKCETACDCCDRKEICVGSWPWSQGTCQVNTFNEKQYACPDKQ